MECKIQKNFTNLDERLSRIEVALCVNHDADEPGDAEVLNSYIALRQLGQFINPRPVSNELP